MYMEKTFINLSNHPSENWDEEQKNAAGQYGRIVDIPFPGVAARADEKEIELLAAQYLDHIMLYRCAAVMVQGEFTFTYHLVKLLEKAGITALAACSERNVENIVNRDGSVSKKVDFRFVRFRKYT